MLLRASTTASNEEVDLHAVNGTSDSGIDNGAALVAFAEAANRLDDNLASARQAIVAEMGEGALMDAAATVAIFRGLNLTADAAGIPLDDDFLGFALPVIAELGIERFPAAVNTPGFT